MPNYESMSLADLDKKFLELRKNKTETKIELRKLNEIREKRIGERKVRKKIDSMTDKEKKIATQILSNAGAIVSEEKIGTPGTK